MGLLAKSSDLFVVAALDTSSLFSLTTESDSEGATEAGFFSFSSLRMSDEFESSSPRKNLGLLDAPTAVVLLLLLLFLLLLLPLFVVVSLVAGLTEFG